MRQAKDEKEWEEALEVQAALAVDNTTSMRLTSSGTLPLPPGRDGLCQPIVPMGAIIEQLGYKMVWLAGSCELYPPRRSPLRLEVENGCPEVECNMALALIAQLQACKAQHVTPRRPASTTPSFSHPIQKESVPENSQHVLRDGSISRGFETMWFSMDASDEVNYSIGPADAGQEDSCVYDLDWTCLPGSEGSTTPLGRDGLVEAGLSLWATVGVGLDGLVVGVGCPEAVRASNVARPTRPSSLDMNFSNGGSQSSPLAMTMSNSNVGLGQAEEETSPSSTGASSAGICPQATSPRWPAQTHMESGVWRTQNPSAGWSPSLGLMPSLFGATSLRALRVLLLPMLALCVLLVFGLDRASLPCLSVAVPCLSCVTPPWRVGPACFGRGLECEGSRHRSGQLEPLCGDQRLFVNKHNSDVKPSHTTGGLLSLGLGCLALSGSVCRPKRCTTVFAVSSRSSTPGRVRATR